MDIPDTVSKTINEDARLVHWKIKQKYESCNRMYDRVYKRHPTWLTTKVTISKSVIDYTNAIEAGPSGEATLQKGRPIKPFTECSDVSKKRKVKDLIDTRSVEELSFAVELSRGKVPHKRLSVIEALALSLDLKLTVYQYKTLRHKINALHPETFPSYRAIKNFKKSLLPNGCTVTEAGAEINMQNLLDKTAASILELIPDINIKSATILAKCGFDGSSGHSKYKQRFSDTAQTDEFMFISAIVPIHMVDNETQNIVWENQTPSSTLFCRPLKFIFAKETAELIKKEYNTIKNCIENIMPSNICRNNEIVIVNHDIKFTMINGSVCNVISGTMSSQVCYICGCTPKEMNAETASNKIPKEDMYQYGLSSLHLRIRCFENLLHIAYRLPFKTWQVRGEENKKIYTENKRKIQDQFKQIMGLLIDIPKPGYGTTNDGNTARRFFSDPVRSASITGIDYNLIQKLGIALSVITSGEKINVVEFKELLEEIKTIYICNYKWYNMSVTMHKLLFHGTNIISNLMVPIGKMSEESLEARHKEIRYMREHHTRKNARETSNEDLMNLLLINSDPILSKYRKCRSKVKKDRNTQDIKKYLLTEDISDASTDTCSESESELI